MDYEKLYKEALERARVYWETDNDNTLDIKAKGTMEYLFPELAESEDERIRKSLCKAIWTYVPTEEGQEYIAWLEKQGKQKQEWSLQDEKNLDDIFCAIRLDNALSDEKQDRLICWLQQYRPYIHKEQKPVEWSEEDDNMLEAILHTLGKIVRYKNFDGAVMSSCENAASWLKSLKQRVQPQPKQDWSKEDEAKLKSACALIRNTSLNGNEGVVDSTIDWLKSLKNRVLPKPANWSEDDKYMIDNLIRIFERNPDDYYKAIRKDMSSEIVPIIFSSGIIDWLKALKDRYTWKPSEEQIKGIECAIKTLQHQLNVGDKRLDSLYDDLKKLRG